MHFYSGRLMQFCSGVDRPPAAFGKIIADDVEKWTKVIKFAGIKSE